MERGTWNSLGRFHNLNLGNRDIVQAAPAVGFGHQLISRLCQGVFFEQGFNLIVQECIRQAVGTDEQPVLSSNFQFKDVGVNR